MYYVKNLADFAHTLSSLQTGPQDNMVCFDVVSLFTRLLITEVLNLLGWYFEEDILWLFQHVLTSSHISFSGSFYEQANGVNMGSLLSSVIVNFSMEDCREMAFNQAAHKHLS
jgi:hypothetical protein